jgi:hypothetical protein
MRSGSAAGADAGGPPAVARGRSAGGLPPEAEDLRARLQLLARRVEALLDTRDPTGSARADPFRGLYLSEEHVRSLLGGSPALPGNGTPDGGAPPLAPLLDESTDPEAGRSRWAGLADAFGLEPVELGLLLVAVAPEVDVRFERLYGFLNDDVTRRRPTVGLALELCGLSPLDPRDRGRLDGNGALVRHGLLEVEEPERPFLGRSLRVPERVVAYLLGGDAPDAALVDVLVAPGPPGGDPAPLARVLAGGEAGLVVVRERPGTDGLAFASAAFAAAGKGALVVDLRRAPAGASLRDLVASACREAVLEGRGLVAGLRGGDRPEEADVLRQLAAARCEAVAVSVAAPDPRDVPELAFVLDAPRPDEGTVLAAWSEALAPALVADAPPGEDPCAPEALAAEALAEVAEEFPLSPAAAARAAVVARNAARSEAAPLKAAHLKAGARSQNAAGLERLARRIVPSVSWSDLVLPLPVEEQLREVAHRTRHRHEVVGGRGLRRGGGRGPGQTALFAGESGTGKTLAAEVVAGELGYDLYAVNLASVVDKYVGETEKNLERIFVEAEGVNGVLFFDEADALFGRRSPVRDAHDRYANVEIAYLLQRMESFDGLAILATNLRSNLDEAFARRLDLVVEFPEPDVVHREELWRRYLARAGPLDDDVDLGFLARRFKLSGGDIRNVATTVAYRCLGSCAAVAMADVISALAAEYRKLGRLCTEAEFGHWFARVSP